MIKLIAALKIENMGFAMRKRIGLFIGEINEYCNEFTDALKARAFYDDTDIYVFVNYGVFDAILAQYSEGEKSFYKLPDYSTFDGIIVEEALMNIEGIENELYEYLHKHASCPVVYLKSVKNDFYSILYSDKQSMKDITKYVIESSGKTDICHMTGRLELDDAVQRLEGYKEAMSEAGIEVTKDMIFYGDYYTRKAKQALDFFYSSRGHYPEAIICANDYMGISLIDELSNRGIRVPEDILISGYDNIPDAKSCTPPLTTVNMDIKTMVNKAYDIIKNLNAGKEVEHISYVRNPIIIRRSTDSSIPIKPPIEADIKAQLRDLKERYAGLENVFFLSSSYDICFTEEELFSSADYHFANTRATKAYICLTVDAFNIQERPTEKLTNFTEKTVLKRIFYGDIKKHYDSPEEIFSTNELLPSKYLEKEPSIYYVTTIHAGYKVYGYMISTHNDGEHPNRYIQNYVGCMANAIDSFNIRKEYHDIIDIRKAYIQDELTGIYNRRGFEKKLLIMKDRAKRHNLYMSVVSIDMDGLKYINDTFGHSEGDTALIEFAKVLLATLNDDEICARYGGDEFSAILISDDKNRTLDFIPKLEENMTLLNNKINKNYTIHASVGIVCCQDYPELDTRACLKLADNQMYENKTIYKKDKPHLIR